MLNGSFLILNIEQGFLNDEFELRFFDHSQNHGNHFKNQNSLFNIQYSVLFTSKIPSYTSHPPVHSPTE